MAYVLSQDHEDIRALVRRIAGERVAPCAPEIDASGEFPWDLKDLLAEHDVLALPFPAEYGGTGTDSLTLVLAIEELSVACATTGLILAAQELGALPIKLAGTVEQKARCLPRLARGEILPAYCLTEREAGSDVGAMRTRARRDGSDWVVDGTKRFITNAGVADYYVVFACQSRSWSTSWASAARRPATSSWTARACRPTAWSAGKARASVSRCGCSTARARGSPHRRSGSRREHYAVDYCWPREAFGRPLMEFQGLQWMAAEMSTEVQAARELLYSCAHLLDDPEANRAEVTRAVAMAKLKAAEVAMWVTTNAVQMLRGYGYIQEYPVERMMRDAKICQIYEGTSQIQNVVIARSLRRCAGVPA